MQTVREQLAGALEGLDQAFDEEHWPIALAGARTIARLALDRTRAEPEETCTTACDQPSEAHCVDHCPCWEAGHTAGLEAQRERVGGGTA